MSDLHSTRDHWGYLQTVTFTHEGRRYACEIDGGPIGNGDDPPISNARWVVTVDEAHNGAGFDAAPDDTAESVRARVLATLAQTPPSA